MIIKVGEYVINVENMGIFKWDFVTYDMFMTYRNRRTIDSLKAEAGSMSNIKKLYSQFIGILNSKKIKHIIFNNADKFIYVIPLENFIAYIDGELRLKGQEDRVIEYIIGFDIPYEVHDFTSEDAKKVDIKENQYVTPYTPLVEEKQENKKQKTTPKKKSELNSFLYGDD